MLTQCTRFMQSFHLIFLNIPVLYCRPPPPQKVFNIADLPRGKSATLQTFPGMIRNIAELPPRGKVCNIADLPPFIADLPRRKIFNIADLPPFLVHLSRRLKCTIVIMRCPSSVVVNCSHFRLLLWNRLMEFNETWQEARSQRPLPSLCFFGPIGKTRWPPWPLIGWDIFDFSSETAARNSTKLDRKQDLNVFYQVCVFRADRKNKMAALASDRLRHFRLLLWNRWTELNETWQEARF